MIVPETFFSIHEEVILFLLSCAAGLFIGVFYDFFRTLRIMIPHNGFFTFIEDLIFLLCYAVFISSFASAEARGELRFYFIIGNFIGFVIYFFTAGKFVTATFRKFFHLISEIFSPLKSLFVLFSKKVGSNFVGINKISSKPRKKINFHLQNDSILLYNIMESKKKRNVNVVARKEKKERKEKDKKTEKSKNRKQERSL